MLIPSPSRTPRKSFVALLWGVFLCGLSACEDQAAAPVTQQAEGEESFVELEEAFLVRATAALEQRLKPESKILEIRVQGDSVSVHMQIERDVPGSKDSPSIPAGSLVQLDYVEHPGEAGQPPIGKIHGPLRVDLQGHGEVKDNLFPLSEVKLDKMGRAFKIAKLAIDPKDGQVERLVIRRNLPFGKRVRGRIFVHSPRMGGTIDVNEKGTPLKR